MIERQDEPQDSWLTTPRAVLIGLALAGALAGAGAFFGMRAGPAVPAAAPTTAAPSTASAPLGVAVSPAPTPSITAPPKALEAARQKATADALAALDARRDAMKKSCPEFATGKPSKVIWNITFDASGKQLARGALEDREASRPGVSNCISRDLTPLTIPPPGATVYVEVPFMFP